jgi:S-formylglutathione hydrolase FrmB
MQFFSRALGRRAIFTFYVPDPEKAPDAPYPAVLQLHGASDNHTSWATQSKLPYYLDHRSFVVIMPDGALSGWSNYRLKGPGTNYEDFIIQDLMPACEHVFPIQPGRWAIGGLSMGGGGALRLGLKHPDRFASIYAHSSGIATVERLRDRFPHLSDDELADADIYAHARRALTFVDWPTLGFDCGIDDALLDHNRHFHAYLDEIGYPHEYRELPGGHTWEYWDEHVQHALTWHADVFGVPAQRP